jgi:hypothetical protein
VVVVMGNVAAGTWSYADKAAGNLLIVGQNGGRLFSSGAPAFAMSSGNVTIRRLSLTSSLSMGIQATGGALTLDHVTVDHCAAGGIMLNGASFDIEDSSVLANGLGVDNVTTNWSGIYVKLVSGTAKLRRVTIASNTNAGILCAQAVDGTEVLAYGNGGGVDVGQACKIKVCGNSDASAGAMCGAQP